MTKRSIQARVRDQGNKRSTGKTRNQGKHCLAWKNTDGWEKNKNKLKKQQTTK